MAAQVRPSNRRGPSGAWSRLKTPTVDALEVYGLPSKGETRLSDSKTQESYYHKIVERYMKFCAATGGGEELDKAFAAMSISAPTYQNIEVPKRQPPQAQSAAASRPSTAVPPRTSSSPPSAQELPTILMAMRKLREAIVSTHRIDVFAQRAYIFIIHAAILTRHMESYHPALLYLLTHIHPNAPLSPPELQEFVGYYILDLACRQQDLAGAYAAKTRYAYKERRVSIVLGALTHDSWFQFWKMKRAVDGYQRVLMSWADESVRLHALKCLGRSYNVADKAFVERAAGSTWHDLVKSGVGWQLDGEKVVIRKMKAP
ncbi:hypothetical protein BJ546DRAFT_689009 [Cryomyces antarcticus]